MRLPLLQIQSPQQRRQKRAACLVLVKLGGAPSEGVDVASNSFPSLTNRGLSNQ